MEFLNTTKHTSHFKIDLINAQTEISATFRIIFRILLIILNKKINAKIGREFHKNLHFLCGIRSQWQM